jgi:hypothetical protein
MATSQRISTMAQPLLVYGYRIVFEAIDPATGATVSGVTITDPNLSGINLSSPAEDTAQTTAVVKPLWLPEPVSSDAEAA